MGNTTEARTIYILLTRSGTWFSRLIHLATADSLYPCIHWTGRPHRSLLQLCPEILPLCPPGRAGGGTNRSGAPDQEAAGPPAASMSCPSPQRYTPASAGRSVLCTPSGSDTTTICWVPSPASSTSRWTGVTTTSAPSSWPASCGTAGRWNSPSRRPWSVLPTSVRSISSGRSTRGTWGGLPALALA